mgnify:FL=1
MLYKKPKQAKEYLQKALNIDPEHDIALIELGKIDKSEGNTVAAQVKFRKAYDLYLKQWKTNSLPKYAYGWFATVAEELGENNFAKEIRTSAPKTESEAYYNKENLSMTKTKALTNNN